MRSFILILLFNLTLFVVVFGQTYSFRTKHNAVNETMNKAVQNANKFILTAIPTNIFKRHFLFNSYQSRLENDTSFHVVTFDDSVNFIPNKYEIMYAVVFVNGDTLTDQFTIPLDSLGNVSVDTADYDYTLEDLKGLKKLFLGKYKYDYNYVKHFIKVKSLKNPHVSFINSKSTLHSKGYIPTKYFKYYWYVSDFEKDLIITYIIDPDTGKYIMRRRKIQAVA